jgi:prepilin-type processing-associated H-X9-DG protein
VQAESPRDVAGMVVPILNDAGTLPASASIRCPGIGSPVTCQSTLADLRTLSADDFARYSPCLSLCYAYSLGHRDDAGTYHPPGDLPKGVWSQTPIMADRPPVEGVFSNSMNHGGAGQNVLFADGHVQFMSTRLFGGTDDIFLNSDGKLAAGRGPGDIVLGPSAARP